MIARLRKAQEQKDQGFTLIELLVVIIIIGILSAIAIPVFMNQSRKAVDQAAQADVSAIAKQVATYYIDNDAALTVTNNASNYTLTNGVTGFDPIVVAKSNDAFTLGPITAASGTVVDGTNYVVTLTFSGGTEGAGATISYSAQNGISGPTAP
ncbi:prepilin-type N-terminal cleavage/methylation domain-containing protein [Cellulomonas sp. HD19AZ1]|uniref:prepilin-type N-terminal cleavage/methylation domain-containing protein n=1 Tax=Cellulomonas sp. HD19AZ1 TaxID=2559593 RepID=UPI00197E4A77